MDPLRSVIADPAPGPCKLPTICGIGRCPGDTRVSSRARANARPASAARPHMFSGMASGFRPVVLLSTLPKASSIAPIALEIYEGRRTASTTNWPRVCATLGRQGRQPRHVAHRGYIPDPRTDTEFDTGRPMQRGADALAIAAPSAGSAQMSRCRVSWEKNRRPVRDVAPVLLSSPGG